MDMSKRKVCAVLWNLLPFAAFVAFFRYGSTVGFFMPLPLLLITVINAILSRSNEEFLAYNGVLLVASLAGIAANGWLYLQYVYYDSEGVAVIGAEILIALLLISAYTAIELLAKALYRWIRKKTR